MIQITPQMRVLVAIEPVDFRRGIDGLGQVCRAVAVGGPDGWHDVCFPLPRGEVYQAVSLRRPRILALHKNGCRRSNSATGPPRGSAQRAGCSWRMSLHDSHLGRQPVAGAGGAMWRRIALDPPHTPEPSRSGTRLAARCPTGRQRFPVVPRHPLRGIRGDFLRVPQQGHQIFERIDHR